MAGNIAHVLVNVAATSDRGTFSIPAPELSTAFLQSMCERRFFLTRQATIPVRRRRTEGWVANLHSEMSVHDGQPFYSPLGLPTERWQH